MSETFTKGMAGIFTSEEACSSSVFLGLTYHTEQTFPERTNASEMTEAVVRGKAVWENNNIGCHSLLGEAPTSRRSWATCSSAGVVRRPSSPSCTPG